MELTEIEVVILVETDKAFKCVGLPDYWLPKSQVEFHPSQGNKYRGAMVVPVWLAEEKGLV